MNGAGDRFRICLIENAIVAERHITDCQIHVIVREHSLFKALHTNVRIGIEVLCNISGDVIQLHHGEALDINIRRHSSGEVTYTGGGFHNSPALESHSFQAVIDSTNNAYFSIVGIQHGSFSSLILFF